MIGWLISLFVGRERGGRVVKGWHLCVWRMVRRGRRREPSKRTNKYTGRKERHRGGRGSGEEVVRKNQSRDD